jgi:hypothetical protein
MPKMSEERIAHRMPLPPIGRDDHKGVCLEDWRDTPAQGLTHPKCRARMRIAMP